MNGTKEIAIRISNATNEFIDSLKEQFGYTEEQAVKIFNVYRKEKIIKLDAAIGRYHLSHGAFWDKEVLDRAAAL